MAFRTVAYKSTTTGTLTVGDTLEVPLPDDDATYGVTFALEAVFDTSSVVFEGLARGALDWTPVRAVEMSSETVVTGTVVLTGVPASTPVLYRVSGLGLGTVRMKVTAFTGIAALFAYARPFVLTPALNLTF